MKKTNWNSFSLWCAITITKVNPSRGKFGKALAILWAIAGSIITITFCWTRPISNYLTNCIRKLNWPSSESLYLMSFCTNSAAFFSLGKSWLTRKRKVTVSQTIQIKKFSIKIWESLCELYDSLFKAKGILWESSKSLIKGVV